MTEQISSPSPPERATALEEVAVAAGNLHSAMVRNMTWILYADAEEMGRLAHLAQALAKLDPDRRP